ncbi:sigma-70 family RNA polymerase sigma factor [Pseudoflavitalea sp. G-6-1-2]|uniref:RNA polymerase sigma factor n=1 Tax=Pseudoflavitalea sp. G-6-1-2 TaxID=2728841 RepID=UPI00146D024C|nr:sigma-70 family RNA polymerase sigma factor [Pseudoflavitalea sp. G-6-1-2]NML22277.1 sigma-70 family RNA polymerase sigma factor [Pseudoflavitalea sp. G-6-1-2]
MVLEPDIIIAFKRGDGTAFEQVYKTYFKRLAYFANKLIGDPEQAEDITTESLLKLWDRRHQFDNPSHIKSWLYITVRNACINFMQETVRHSRSHQEISYLSTHEEEDIDRHRIDAELINEIHHQLQFLPAQCAQVFELIYFRGKSTVETANLLQTSTKNVLNQKLKAIKLLKAQLLKRGLFLFL